MKKFLAYFLIILPSLTFGQLFPKVPDFRGNLRLVTEKKYGREVADLKQSDGKYRPAAFSGWVYTFSFDKSGRLIRRTESDRNKIESDFKYSYKSDGSGEIIRQIESSLASGQKGNYLETEIFPDRNGQISRVIYTSFDAGSGKSTLYLIENDAKYLAGKLTSFNRMQFDENGDTTSTEICRLIYDDSGRLSSIRRTDLESSYSTIINLHYNWRGWVDRYSVDLFAELQELGKKQIQDIYYRYDRHGNWKRMYRGTGKKKQLEAKRKIKYW